MLHQDTLNSIDWDQILEIDLHVCRSLPKKQLRSELNSALNLLFFYETGIKNNAVNCEFLFFKSMPRDDYKDLFDTVFSCCKHSKFSLDFSPINSWRLKLSKLNTIRKLVKPLRKKLPRNLFKAIFILTKASHYVSVCEDILSCYSFKHLVVFADMQPIDNLLAQLSNNKAIPTSTLQHGLYIDYSRQPNINTVNYENSPAANFLSWGRATGKLMKQWHPKKAVFICGKPTLNRPKATASAAPAKYFTVLFDQNLLAEKNREMLSIAFELTKELGILVNIRFHPRNNPRGYGLRKTTLINQDPLVSRFVLAHTTSMIHEIMRLGVPVFKYDTDVPSIDVPSAMKFQTSNDIIEKLESLAIQSIDPEGFSLDHIEVIGDISKERYSAFFDDMVEAKRDLPVDI